MIDVCIFSECLAVLLNYMIDWFSLVCPFFPFLLLVPALEVFTSVRIKYYVAVFF